MWIMTFKFNLMKCNNFSSCSRKYLKPQIIKSIKVKYTDGSAGN